jgi:predicted ATPase/DNA-binding winged helix-turn-helix (wHTH) protein
MTERGEREPQGYRFGPFSLFPQQRKLLQGDDPVAIGQRALSILVFLVENVGRVVTYDEIMDRACGGIAIDLRTLSTHIGNLRDILGRDSIATINSQGYQFTLPVETLDRPLPRPIVLPRVAGVGRIREPELAALADHLAQNRLVTVVGPGGLGKTWLALELGSRAAEQFPDGVHLIDLSPIPREWAAVCSAVARALGVALRGVVQPGEALAGWIGVKKLLLIVDSCEGALDQTAGLIEMLLARTPHLQVLATSQESLHLPREKVYRLQPLDLNASIELFSARAAASDQNFLPGPGNAATIAEICRRLDGLPLALEMAAALLPYLSLKEVRDGLDERFEMLTQGSRVAKDSHSTLLKLVEWSHGLLNQQDRETFRRLAVFAGSFSSEAALAVAGAEIDRWTARASLRRLNEKSLLIIEPGEAPRYRMLETMRLYARERLRESGEEAVIAERHARYYAQLLEPADAIWETISDSEWRATYAPEIDNIRGALDWSLADKERTEIGIVVAGSTGRLWNMLDLVPEGRRYCDRLIDRIEPSANSAGAARLLRRGGVLWLDADRSRSVVMLERSAAIYRELRDPVNLGIVMGHIGGICVYLGRLTAARAALSEASALLSASGPSKSLSNITTDFGALAISMRDFAEAAKFYNNARTLARELKDPVRELIALCNLAEVEFGQGAIERAIARAREAANGFRDLGQSVRLARVQVNMAAYLALRGDCVEARQMAREALASLRKDGGEWLRLCLQVWALLGVLAGKDVEAAQLIGFVNADYDRSGYVREPLEQEIFGTISKRLAAALTAADIAFWNADGAQWTADYATDFVSRMIVSAEDLAPH